mmetsp:Transcript_16949/g.41292  ORF Transcript_16949/g.41292 Transcript_16949/m.41292 type:complete len:101 (-) Transcript_16949:1440-1742(-)
MQKTWYPPKLKRMRFRKLFQSKEMKKSIASLRFCVSSLHRDHANLLCIFKRLFDVLAEARTPLGENMDYMNCWSLRQSAFELFRFMTRGCEKHIMHHTSS